jgi:predicted phosphodiesterase
MAVLSDIHGNYHALQAVLDDLQNAGDFDRIWNLGDYMAFGPHPAECVQTMMDIQKKFGDDTVQMIPGNTDRYILTGERPSGRAVKDEDSFKELAANFSSRDAIFNWSLEQLNREQYEFLATMKHELRLRVDGYGPVYGFHAIPGDDEGMELKPGSDDGEARDALLDRQGKLAFTGHTHLQMNRDLGTWQVVNPGSIGMSFTDPHYAEWAIVTIEAATVDVDLRRVSYDYEAMIDDLQSTGHPDPPFMLNKLG